MFEVEKKTGMFLFTMTYKKELRNSKQRTSSIDQSKKVNFKEVYN
jgi:non-homologous end joining protein Ku